MIDLEETFNALNEHFLKFEKVENKKSNRPDLHAFLLLDSLFPLGRDLVSAAEHDEIFLSIDMDDFRKIATDEIILELVRCGVRYSEDYDCFCMFV